MTRRIFAAGIVVIVAAALLIAVWPQLFGLERQPVVAQLVSLRGLAALVAGVGVVTLLLVALISRRMRRLAASIALLLLVFVGVSAAVLATRGATPAGFQTKADADITVLSWNTLGDSPGAAEIAKLALAQHADIVALPETSTATAQAVAQLMGQSGSPMQVLHVSFGHVAKSHTTSLLISTSLGAYRVDAGHGSTKTLPSVVAVPVDGDGPTIVAAHPVSPVPGEMADWRDGLDWLAQRCALGGDVILAGDLNSTLDHYSGLGTPTATGDGDLGACHDGARAEGSAAVGTWPTSLPAQLGAPIDHVMASNDWSFVGFRVIGNEDGAGSDHRPIVAQLRPGH
ncbi:MAG TPA: endonuclease/exonuclease/phosphatase family protein [Pseudolysinimonas sp.]